MSSANRFLTTSEQNHDQATEKTLSDMNKFLKSGNLEVNGSIDVGITEIIANSGTDLNTSLLALESGGNLTNISSAYNSNQCDINLVQLGGSNISQSLGVQNVNLLSSIPSSIGHLVDVRANRINSFRLQEIIMATDGLSSADTRTSLGDLLSTGDLITIPTSQIAIGDSAIGGIGAGADDGAIIEIQYYATDSATSITTVNVTLLSGHQDGQALTFAWFRIVRLRIVSGSIFNSLYIGNNVFAGGIPTVSIYKNMAGDVGVSRNGNTYLNPDEEISLAVMTVTNNFNVSGAIYRLDCRLRRDATTNLDELLFQSYIRQAGASILDYSNIDQIRRSNSNGMDLIFTITRTNSTHNEKVVINLSGIVQDLS